MNSMPPAITGPGPLSDPPFAATPLTVVNAWAVLYSHSTLPSAVEYARIIPLVAPEKTTPGITVIAADCACTGQLRSVGAQVIAGGRACQASSPVASASADRPPASAPACESAVAK